MSILNNKQAWALTLSFLLLWAQQLKAKATQVLEACESSPTMHTQVGVRATWGSAMVSSSSIGKDGDIVLSETRTGQGLLIFFTLTQILLLSFTTFICKFGVLYPAVSGLFDLEYYF